MFLLGVLTHVMATFMSFDDLLAMFYTCGTLWRSLGMSQTNMD
jgi:hypothetical protein